MKITANMLLEEKVKKKDEEAAMISRFGRVSLRKGGITVHLVSDMLCLRWSIQLDIKIQKISQLSLRTFHRVLTWEKYIWVP